MASKQQQAFKMCVHPCPRYLTGGDTHTLCVACLGEEHAQSALESAGCEHCEVFPLRTLRSRLAFFREDAQARVPQGSGPAAAEAQRRLRSWGSQMDLSAEVETGTALSLPSPDRFSASYQGWEARAAVSSAPIEAHTLQLSDSEELDAANARDTEDSPPQSRAYEELVEVVTRAVEKLNIDWPAEREDVRSRGKLDERFLPSRAQPQRRGLPFFPDLHTEVSRSWEKPVSYRVYSTQTSHYSSILNVNEHGYGEMPKVEETLASYLSPESSSSIKSPTLPTKPVRITSALVGKAYSAAGQAAACLHTMSLLQAYQAELLIELDEGEGFNPSSVCELRRATDLSLRAAKETAKSIGRSMAALVATERHLWLNRSANPATSCASGRSGLQRAHIPRSTRKRSGLGMPAPSEEGFGTVSADASCRFTASGRRSDCTNRYKSRNQSREAGTASRIFDSVETSAKYISLGPADYKKRVSDTVWVSPAQVHGVLSTEVAPQQVLAREQEIKALLEKEAIEYVPHSNRETGFYSRYFIVPKKDGGLRPILDLRVLNVSVLKLKFKMLTLRQIVSQIRSEDWFVTIDLKDAYFHISILPYHREFLRFAFGGKAYQYRVLPFGLALSPRTFTKCVDAALVPLRLQGIRIMNYIDDWLILAQSHQLAVWHRDVVLAHMEKLGLRLNAKKSVLSPLQRTTFLGVIWDSTSMQARLSPARIESILSAVKRIRLGQSLTVGQFQRLLGLMAAASNVIPVGLLHMRPLQWWLRTKGFSPRGNPFRMIKVTRRCLRALVMWKQPWFLSQGPMLGASCRRKTLTTDASLTGWGAILEGRSGQGLWRDHHLSWHINRLEMLAVFLALKNFLADLRGHHVLVRSDNKSVVSYINHQGGLRSRPLCKLACQILLWSQGKLLSLRATYIPGVHNIRADILSRQGLRPGEWRLHPEVVELIWKKFGQAQVDLFASRETSHCPLWFSLTHPAPLGLDAMTQTWPRLRLYAFPPIALLPGVLERVRRDRVPLLLIAPRWPGRVWFPNLFSLLDGPPLELPVRRDLLSQAGGSIFHPHPELWKLWAWPLRGPSS